MVTYLSASACKGGDERVDPTVLSSLISAGVAIMVCIITQYAQNRKTVALIEYKIEELTKKVDKHNNLIERTYKLEETMALHDEKIKVANHRIDDLEEKVV